MASYEDLVKGVRDAYNTGRTRPIAWRKAQLTATIRMLDENEGVILDALKKDLRKPKAESYTTELEFVRNEMRTCLRNIDRWTETRKADLNVLSMLDRPLVVPEPYGVVLIMSAWNYPLHLLLAPMGGALSAGNAVVLKPSDLAVHVAEVVERLVPRYLDPEAVRVVNGGIPETTALLRERFDYICYTGSSAVGKIIGEAANKHLTPCTLELGGKSPVYIDDTCDFKVVARRLLWGKLINLGQTCVAPDYVLCSPAVDKRLVSELSVALTEWYGANPQQSPDLCRIINERHFDRLSNLIKTTTGEVVIGGKCDRSERFIEPTVISGASPSDPVMQEEIFGPLLPILHVDSHGEAIDFINAREKPLALYVYSTAKRVQDAFVERTSSGSVAVNDNVLQMCVESLPFGGVGSSGYGAYHGDASFDTFSHRKAVLVRDQGWLGEFVSGFRYPPYSDGKNSLLKEAMKSRWFPNGGLTGYMVSFVLGGVVAAATLPASLW